jgi:L-lactate dehydrogenase complex protein LldE
MTQGSAAKASLFVTCIIDQMYPEVGISAVRVLRRLGVDLDFPPDQACCGQPLYNSGFVSQSRRLAERTLESFRDSEYVVVPSGSCAAMLRVFYLDLFSDDPSLLHRAEELSNKVYEFSQFLVDVLGIEDVAANHVGKVAYHPSCHLLREMNVREQPLALLRSVQGLELEDLPGAETCCGFGGAFAVKFPHISEAMLAEKIENLESTGADVVVSCDMGCLMNIGGGLSRRGSGVEVRHLAQLLDSHSNS